MIYVVVGKLGGGKSLTCAYLGACHVKKNLILVSNCDYKLEGFRVFTGRNIRRGQLIHINGDDDPSKIPTGDNRGTKNQRKVMIVIDEALNWFSSSGSVNDPRKAKWGEWLRQSDKLGQDVYLIAQQFNLLAKWIRDLAHTIIFCQDLQHNRLWNVLPYPYPLSRCIAATKYQVATKERTGLTIFAKRKELFYLYDTAQMFGALAYEQNLENAYLKQDHVIQYPHAKSILKSILVITFIFVIACAIAPNGKKKKTWTEKVLTTMQERFNNEEKTKTTKKARRSGDFSTSRDK